MTNTNALTFPSDPTVPEVRPERSTGRQLAKGAVAVAVAAALGVLAFSAYDESTVSSDPPATLSDPPTARLSPDAAERWAEVAPVAEVPMSADAAERWAEVAPVAELPRSADAAERWAQFDQERADEAACLRWSRGLATC